LASVIRPICRTSEAGLTGFSGFMSIEYRSDWLRPPNAEDMAELVHALSLFGALLGPPRGELVAQIIFQPEAPSSDVGPDISLYADIAGVLVSFHSGTRTQRAAVVRELERVLSERKLGTGLEED